MEHVIKMATLITRLPKLPLLIVNHLKMRITVQKLFLFHPDESKHFRENHPYKYDEVDK